MDGRDWTDELNARARVLRAEALQRRSQRSRRRPGMNAGACRAAASVPSSLTRFL